ncbi:hypothetical protein CK489_00845 [Bradyrhizobium sp. UFLA03-84]|nr:hypothetical protein CK489_00845 [Bradyrhizobium sp. UFLA03-84]
MCLLHRAEISFIVVHGGSADIEPSQARLDPLSSSSGACLIRVPLDAAGRAGERPISAATFMK